jgi:hypothetical protein
MTTANGQFLRKCVRQGSSLKFLAAILLILLGIVLQLSELGYGHLRAENFWLVSMIATSLWNLFAVHANAPGVHELVSFWPLLLICLGLGGLLTEKSFCSFETSSPSRARTIYEK